MHYLEFNEDKQRGTQDFPFEFYHVEEQHPQYVMPYHWHIEYELIRILEGSFMAHLDEREFTAYPGDVIFIGNGVLHAGRPDHCVYECIVFDINTFLNPGNICRKLMQSMIEHSLLIHQHFPGENQCIHQTVWNIFDSFQAKRQGYQLSVIGGFYCFFGMILEHHYYLAGTRQTPRNQKRILQLKKVLEFIDASYTTNLSLSEMAAVVTMSPKYFCKFFYEMTHQTPISYVNSYRIERACHLLITSDYPVTEIAFNCGFNDTSYFIKTFKKYKGSSPRKYLKQL